MGETRRARRFRVGGPTGSCDHACLLLAEPLFLGVTSFPGLTIPWAAARQGTTTDVHYLTPTTGSSLAVYYDATPRCCLNRSVLAVKKREIIWALLSLGLGEARRF